MKIKQKHNLDLSEARWMFVNVCNNFGTIVGTIVTNIHGPQMIYSDDFRWPDEVEYIHVIQENELKLLCWSSVQLYSANIGYNKPY